MIHLAFVLSRLANAVSAEPARAIPQHLTILDAALYCWELDEDLNQLVTDPADGSTAVQQPERFTRLLLDRLRAEKDLNTLLTTPCCAPTPDGDVKGPDHADPSSSGEPYTGNVVDACLQAFRDAGLPAAMSSADLVSRLRSRPGLAGSHWNYAELTPLRLSRILAPHGVRPRTIRFPERQLKGYLRTSFPEAARSAGSP
ncbi:DUF3631 domain-containing protein [Streptomyces globisporus]|uniref:DUF3631 domain-containing protein n=1 Tax=Streptomyces globisporus TaxID=1908 RepID=UPI00364EFA06